MQKAGVDEKEKTGQRVRKKLLNNLGLKLVSVVIAVVLWFGVVIINNPKDSRVFSNIPVTLVNTELLDKEGKVYEVLDNTDVVRVTVEVPKDSVNLLRSSDIVAEADVSMLTAVNTVAITCKVLNEDVNVIDISCNHDVVRLNVEDKATRWISVNYGTSGEVAEGYMVADVTNVTRIKVSGPKSVVDQISYAGGEIDVTGATTNQTANMKPQLYDAEGNVLDSSRVTMENASSIFVEAIILATKEVPIELKVTGTPAPGYLATGRVECEPSRVLICGTLSALAEVSKIVIPEKELDITDATGNVVNFIPLNKYLPTDVKLADSGFNGEITATVRIEAEKERTLSIPAANITVLGMPADIQWETTGGQSTYELKVAGLNLAVVSVDGNRLQGTVDVGAWMQSQGITALSAGTYQIPVEFALPKNVNQTAEVLMSITILETEEEE